MKVATETLNLSPCCKTPQHRKKDENIKKKKKKFFYHKSGREKGKVVKMLLKMPCF